MKRMTIHDNDFMKDLYKLIDIHQENGIFPYEHFIKVLKAESESLERFANSIKQDIKKGQRYDCYILQSNDTLIRAKSCKKMQN